MKQPTLLQMAERLESLTGRLPEKIRRPVLREMTPLKELFLKQRAPRFLFTGSSRLPMHQIVQLLFAPEDHQPAHVTLMPLHRWADWVIPGRGAISILDAREAERSAEPQIAEEIKCHPPDMIFVFDDGEWHLNKPLNIPPGATKIIALSPGPERRAAHLQETLDAQLAGSDRLLAVVRISESATAERQKLMSLLAEHLPNEAKIEMIRISRDPQAQAHVAHLLIKSATAICAAIGAQPIPLADMPVLTTLQVLMVSGIMYISGRERNLRAATEFIGALGANLGAAMILREGARALLKFFPGWGNVVCGMVAAAGTYAIGRAATAYFLEGASLKEARRRYLKSRRKPSRLSLTDRRRGALPKAG